MQIEMEFWSTSFAAPKPPLLNLLVELVVITHHCHSLHTFGCEPLCSFLSPLASPSRTRPELVVAKTSPASPSAHAGHARPLAGRAAAPDPRAPCAATRPALHAPRRSSRRQPWPHRLRELRPRRPRTSSSRETAMAMPPRASGHESRQSCPARLPALPVAVEAIGAPLTCARPPPPARVGEEERPSCPSRGHPLRPTVAPPRRPRAWPLGFHPARPSPRKKKGSGFFFHFAP